MHKVGCLFALPGLALQLAVWGAPISGKRKDVPLTVLRQRADVIVLATATQVGRNNPTSETVQLQVQRVLQGQAQSSLLSVQLKPPPQLPGISLPSSAVGQLGIWFLKNGSDGYNVLPLVDGLYIQTEFFLPVNDSATATPPAGTVDQQLLAYLVRWYLSVPNPGPYEDRRLLSSLDAASRQDALAAIPGLLSSISLAHRTVGLAAAIHLGLPDALAVLQADIPKLSSSSKLFQIIQAIQTYRPAGTSSIAPLQRLIESHAGVPGLDVAVGGVLRRIGTRAIAPAMAELLDSKDPNAQLLAATFFGTYSLFADANGNFPDSGPVGPFATADTRQFTPQSNSGVTPAMYAEFWKTWWTQNYARLGFSAP
ncbi:MAG TPA: hypothetical protein VFW83_03340 [Bryobacteraceae bacterium]|nr:hypothetical protein [Bryobacteraceae bacterium]